MTFVQGHNSTSNFIIDWKTFYLTSFECAKLQFIVEIVVGQTLKEWRASKTMILLKKAESVAWWHQEISPREKSFSSRSRGSLAQEEMATPFVLDAFSILMELATALNVDGRYKEIYSKVICAGTNIPYVKNDFRCVQNCASRLELTQNTSVKY